MRFVNVARGPEREKKLCADILLRHPRKVCGVSKMFSYFPGILKTSIHF